MVVTMHGVDADNENNNDDDGQEQGNHITEKGNPIYGRSEFQTYVHEHNKRIKYYY